MYEYAVEPAVLQNLPDQALLLVTRGSGGPVLTSVECDPAIVTLPRVSSAPLPDPADVRLPAGGSAQRHQPAARARTARPRIRLAGDQAALDPAGLDPADQGERWTQSGSS